MSDLLSWEELEPLASEWDCVWNDPPKLEWAKEAWRILTEAGLTSYSSEIDRVRVAMRFLGLAGLFADFYQIAFTDGFEPQYLDLCNGLEITPFRLGQLVGEDSEWSFEEEDLDSLLQSLANDSRKEIYLALTSGFGGLSGLFISLWKSNPAACSADYGDDGEEDNLIVSNNLTPEKFEVYQWLSEGCYPWGA